MKYELFTRVALNTDLPQYGLRSGDGRDFRRTPGQELG